MQELEAHNRHFYASHEVNDDLAQRIIQLATKLGLSVTHEAQVAPTLEIHHYFVANRPDGANWSVSPQECILFDSRYERIPGRPHAVEERIHLHRILAYLEKREWDDQHAG
jgi:hypothetical protein